MLCCLNAKLKKNVAQQKKLKVLCHCDEPLREEQWQE